MRRTRLFTTVAKNLSTQTQICDYFGMDVYKQQEAFAVCVAEIA